MRFFSAVVLLFPLFSTAYGFCGSDAGSKEDRDGVQKILHSIAQSKLDITNRTLSKNGAFTVPVVWNVFYDRNNPSDGNYADSVITQTHNVVNSYYYNQVGLYFAVQYVNRIGIDYNTLHGAAVGNSVEAYLKQYRYGDIRTLNIYTVGQNPSGLAGWSSFPWEYQQNPQNDGIVYDYNFLPGGRNVNYNTGKIVAHEIGHWVGLLHTFQDGCNGGDYVDDTPAEYSPASGCPAGRDTCSALGADPIGVCLVKSCTSRTDNQIDNMMDYSDDTCRIRFTNGQYNRLAQILYQYRGINLY